MIGPRPDCMDCKNINTENVKGITCKAFPNGISMNILVEQKKHSSPLPGQVGEFVFERK